MSKDTQPAMTYPPNEQYQTWKDDAAEMDMSVSEWMRTMIEAGRKKFEVSVEPDQTNNELRQQRAELKRELDDARERISRLEDELYHTEQQAIIRYVENNPGAEWADIMQRLSKTLDERATRHLNTMEGNELRRSPDGGYFIRRGGEK